MTQLTQQPTERRLLRLHPDDDCLVAAISLRAGEAVDVEGTLVELQADLPVGHKIAAHALGAGQAVRKCGAIIGRTTVDVSAGEHLHLHNLRSDYLPAHLVGGADADVELVAMPALNLDAAVSEDTRLSALVFDRWAVRMGEHGIPDAQARAHFAAWADEDRYFPLDAELNALREAGFDEVECFWRRGPCAITCALRAS